MPFIGDKMTGISCCAYLISLHLFGIPSLPFAIQMDPSPALFNEVPPVTFWGSWGNYDLEPGGLIRSYTFQHSTTKEGGK